MDIPILITKLHLPVRRPDLVSRPRLLAQLDAGLRQHRKLTLISAPAGYGKTTLVTDWLHGQAEARFAWLALDEADNDPQRFLDYVLSALQRVEPACGEGARSLLHGPQSASGTACLTLLLNDLATLEVPLILVLDDHHVIRSPEVHELLDFLLAHAPGTLCLVLLTREDPPLALSRLRARGQLTELRAADLRFTHEEATTFFRETLGLTLDAEAVATLETRTEGWVASLQLAGLALQSQVEQQTFLAQFGGSHRYVIDYLLDEVLRHQPPAVRNFLTCTSILERLCAPLCDALLDDAALGDGEQKVATADSLQETEATSEGEQSPPHTPKLRLGDGISTPSPSAAILQTLEKANLFLVPLDAHRTWYRYHHLFADALRSGLAPDTAQALHQRAAHWFAGQGLRQEAIQHALAAGDFSTAAAWIADASETLIRNGRIVTLLGWLDAMPVGTLNAHPILAAAKAMALLLTGQMQEVQAYITALEQTQAARDPALQGKLLALRAWLIDARGGARVPDTAEKALDLIPEQATLFRILALIPLAHARTAAGDIVGSTQALRDAYRIAEADAQPFAALGALANLAFNLLEQGSRREALALCEAALSRYVDAQGQPLPALGLVYLPMATAHYIGDNLEQAERYAREGLALCRMLFSDTMAGGDSERVLAQVHFARGDPDAAFAVLEQAQRAVEQQGMTQVALTLAATEARLRLRQGDVAVVEAWLDSLGQPTPPQVQLAYMDWLLATQRWDEAEALLEERAQQLEDSEQFGRLVYIRLLQVQASAGQGQRAEALAYLEDAVARAAPEGYRRIFLDAPTEVQMLLPHVQTTSAGTEISQFVADLLSRSGYEALAIAGAPDPEAAALDSAYELDPLSERELEVLGLIAAGLSNREIAERLYISIGTVKRHAHNIYSKLQANSRTQAVARARELGIIV